MNEAEGMDIKMISPERNNMDVNRIWRGQGNVPGGGRNSSARRENNFLTRMLEASGGAPEGKTENVSGRESGEKSVGDVSPKEEFDKNQASAAQLIRGASEDGKKPGRDELLKLLADHREEILKKIKNSDTGVKIPIGSMLLTQEEWEKLLDSFDEAQEQIQEEIRAENGETLPEKKDTTVNGDKVFAPEDTGHDLKSLEELIGETNGKGKTANDPDEQNLLTDEEERQA